MLTNLRNVEKKVNLLTKHWLKSIEIITNKQYLAIYIRIMFILPNGKFENIKTTDSIVSDSF